MPRVTNTPPRIPASALRGEELKQDEAKVVSTKSHDIELNTNVDGSWLPDFKVERRHIADPGARSTAVDVDSARLGEVRTGADFGALLKELQEANKEWLSPDKQAFLETLPEGDRSNFAFINIIGRRTEQFFDEATRLIGRSGLSGNEAAEARKALNFAHRDAFRGRSVDFDKADTGTYWSYGHYPPCTHVFDKMRAAMPDDDPKRKFVQAQLDYVFSKKFVPDGGVRENDCESSLELMAIDRENRHVVSMVKDSESTNNVRYETIKVAADAAEHAGEHVYRDGDKYFFEGTGAEVSADLVAGLVREPAGEVVFRRPLEDEQPRGDFRFDWNGNRMLNTERIDTGWWGHCDIKATIETLLADMDGSAGVKEYRADTGVTTDFTRDMQLEALAALLNFDDRYYATRGGGQASFGNTDFAGGRWDDRPSKMTLKTDRGDLPFNVRISKLYKKDDPDGGVEDLDRIFATKLVDDADESFTDNPDILRVEERDTNYIDGSGRKLDGRTDGYTFDSSGRPVESKTSFTIDPNADSGDRVLIGTELKNINDRELTRFYYDPATKGIISVDTQFVEENGTFEAKEGRERSLGNLRGMELGREMLANDDIQGKIDMLEEAVRVGGKIATDSDKREQVWNGEVHAVRMETEWRSDDGKWERVGVHVDATFGNGKVGSILHKLDENGQIEESLELKAAVDFYWRDRPRVAPLVSERGNWFVNKSMYDRGVIALGDDTMTSIGVIQDMNDLIYLGLKAKDDQQVFSIVHEGKRFLYEDEASWQADIDRLQGGQSPGGGGTDPQPAGGLKGTSEPNLGIPDNDPAGISDVISLSGDGKIKGIKIDLDLKHTYVGDLNVSLTAPDGTEVTLHKRGGRGRDDIVGTYGDDLTSFDRLDDLFGKAAAGDWTLKVTDMAGRDVGSLVSWGLDVDVES
jgi:subtilisin-like proprotein convertase family protein